MEQFPMNTPEAAQGAAPQAEQSGAEAGAAEALTAEKAAGLGGAALEAAAPEVPGAEAVQAPEAEAAPMPEVQAVNMTPVPEAAAPVTQPAAGGEAGVASAVDAAVAEATAMVPGAEAVKSPEMGKVSDTEMVNYIIGRLRGDLDLPETKEQPEKAKQIESSIQIFDQVAFVLGESETKKQEPVPVETILTVMASGDRYAAGKSQDEAAKADWTQRASLADEWAGSYANRKAKLEAERSEGKQADAATEKTAAPVEEQNQATPDVVTGEASTAGMAAAAPAAEAGVGVEQVEQAPLVPPANAGETTQPNAVPLSTEGIV